VGPGALAGVRVADLTGGRAGPVAGMLLADLGADVIKVGAPGGGPSAAEPGLHMWDRGKRSAVLDPARAGDLAALDRLVSRADVVLVGTQEPGLGYQDLLDRGLAPGQPALWVVLPPYLLGETPWAGGRESAGLLFAWLGHAWSQSSYADVPVDCLYPVALHMQGIWAATTAVAALTGRQAGRAVAPLIVAGGAHGAQLVSPGGFAAGRDDPHVHRTGGPGGALANYRCYRCADGTWLFFGAFTTAFIERGFHAVGAAALLADPRVGGDPAAVRLPDNLRWITRELERVFAARPRSAWIELLEAADVPVAAVGEAADWLDHEQVAAAGLRAVARNDAGQDIVMPGPLIGLSATPAVAGPPAATQRPALADLDPGWPERPAAGGWAAGGPGAGGPGAGGPGAGRPAEPPLAGRRVLDLGTIIAGPYVATLLGELGAEVIKVERPPGGDEFRTAHGGRGGVGFSVYNRDQRSVLVDLTADRGRELFGRLAGSADVVVDNYRAGVAARLGIGHEQLAAASPLVTSVSISAFGETGPLGRRPGFDPVIQAMSGIMRAQGGPDQADSPAFLTVPINDVLAAGLGALGACASLYARDRLGAGQQVTITLCASSCLLQSEYLVRFPGAPPFPAGGRDFAGPGVADRLYECADGWVRFGAPGPSGLAALAAAGLTAADPELATSPEAASSPAAASSPEPARVPEAVHSPELAAAAEQASAPEAAAAVAQAVAGLPVAEVLRRAAAAGVPAVRARRPQELTGDGQLIARGMLTVVDTDAAGVARVGPGRWLDMPGLTLPPPGEAPAAGEHEQAILAELGAAPA
jgi:crotonobetainyl-CoA:carnitine CoA-transferase CaiB-like acyl-CoA transferase